MMKLQSRVKSLLLSSAVATTSRKQFSHARFYRLFSSSKTTAAPTSTGSGTDFYTVGITGSSGCVGNALLDELLEKRRVVNDKPVRVVRLIRSAAAEKAKPLFGQGDKVTSLMWNPNGNTPDTILDPEATTQLDAIVHLAGENVGTGLGPLGFLGIRPWSDKKKQEILDSRVTSTTALSKVVQNADKPLSFLVASGIGCYGLDFIGDKRPAADESMDISQSEGFLAQISRDWEAATKAANTNNKHAQRVVNMRFAVALSKKGGALQKLYPVFLFGGGGIIGNGDQYFTFISARDLARGIVHCIETPSIQGPVNLCAPNPCTNSEFTKALGGVLKRPTLLPFPSFAVSLMFGQMGEEMLLGGVRAVPQKLQESGFKFQHPTIQEALASAMEEDI